MPHALCACKARRAGCHAQGACGCAGCCVPCVRVPPLRCLAPGGPAVPVPCPWGPVPAELLTRGGEVSGPLQPPARRPPRCPLQRRWAVTPRGQPKLTRPSLCHGDAGRLLWQRGEVWGPLSCPARALSCSPPGFPAYAWPNHHPLPRQPVQGSQIKDAHQGAKCLRFRLAFGSPLSPRGAGPMHGAGAVMAKIHSEDVWCQGAQTRGAWGLPAWKTAPWLRRVRGGAGVGAVPVGAGAVVGRQNIPGGANS